jgi:hypothetical protein
LRNGPRWMVRRIVVVSSLRVVATSAGLPPKREPPQTSCRVFEEKYSPRRRFPEIEPRGVRIGGILRFNYVGRREKRVAYAYK